MSIAERVHDIGRRRQRKLRGETVTIPGDISAEISGVIVAFQSADVARDDGPAEYSGTLTVPTSERPKFLATKTVEVRSASWDILTVGRPYGDNFIVEIGRIDGDHANLFDLKQEQAEWNGT